MPEDSNINAVTADFIAMVFRASPWTFPGLDEAECVELGHPREAQQLAGTVT